MLRKILSKRSKTKGPNAAAEEAKANVDLSKCLAQVQEILGKLRQGQEGQDPFPSLNEASRIVTVMENEVKKLPADDPVKEIWMEQVSEAQRELQLVTDSMVSKMSTETGHSTDVNKSEAAPQVDNGGGMDDLFSGLMMSTTVPPAAVEEKVSTTGQADRPELDSSLFSDLVLVDSASQKIDSADSTPIISRIPSSPTPRRNKHPEDQSNLPVSPTKSSTLLGPNAPEYRQKGIGQHEQQPSVQPTLMAKKKKKGQRVGYAREPEMPAGGKLRENIQSHSAGSGVDVRPGSQQSQVSDSASHTSRAENGSRTSIPTTPSATSDDAQKRHPSPQKGAPSERTGRVTKMTLDAVINKGNKCNSIMAESLSTLEEKERRLTADRTELLLSFAEGKAHVAELESQQLAAVGEDDFEKAASLAVKIEAQASTLEAYQQDISEVERSMCSCSFEKTKVLEKAMQMFNTVVSDVRKLRDDYEESSIQKKTERKEELSHIEDSLSEKTAIIKEIESCIPEERDGIAASQLRLEEEASDRKQERTEKTQSLQQQQQQLKGEIEELKAELAAKESSLKTLTNEVDELVESEDEDFKKGIAQLSKRKALLEKEESRLCDLKKTSSDLKNKCEETREAVSLLEEDHKKRMGKFSSACSMFEEEINSLAKDMQRGKDSAVVLVNLAKKKADADAKRHDLELQCKKQADQVKDFGNQILRLGTDIRALEEEIGKADVRLPEIQNLKSAAAAAKDFQEAASLSSQAKELAAQKEAAEEQLHQKRAQLSDAEERQLQMTKEVATLRTNLELAVREAAFAQYAQLNADLQMMDLNLVVEDSNSRQAIRDISTLLTKEYGFDRTMLKDSIVELEKLS